VEDRRIDHLRDVGAVARRARVLGDGGEADEVVDDDVDRAADGVPLELRVVQTLGDDALAGERGIAVDQERDHAQTVGIAAEALLGPAAAKDHCVHRFKVAGIAGHRQVHLAAGEVVLARIPAVVLHVAAAIGKAFFPVVLEFREDLLVGLVHHVVEDVQSAAVGHAHHALFNADRRGRLEHHVDRRDRALAPLEAEPLLARVPLLDEPLKSLRTDELLKHLQALLTRQRNLALVLLEVLEEPAALFRIGDVRELQADRPAVGLLQPLDKLAERHRALGVHDRKAHLPIKVRLGQAIVRERELLGALLLAAEGIGLGRGVAEPPVIGDERIDACLEIGGSSSRLADRRCIRAGHRVAKIKALEERTDVGRDRRGVCTEACVLLVEVLGVPTVDGGGIGRDGCARRGSHGKACLVPRREQFPNMEGGKWRPCRGVNDSRGGRRNGKSPDMRLQAARTR
jgi:hypothetical protein